MPGTKRWAINRKVASTQQFLACFKQAVKTKFYGLKHAHVNYEHTGAMIKMMSFCVVIH